MCFSSMRMTCRGYEYNVIYQLDLDVIVGNYHCYTLVRHVCNIGESLLAQNIDI